MFEKTYPCVDCGVLRTEKEGGAIFTVCDDCYDKHYKPKKAKTAEQEARAFKQNELEKRGKNWKYKPAPIEEAHLAGQSVGYQRALEEVLAGCIKDQFWLGPPDRFDPVIEIGAVKRIITNLKAKGGA